MNHLGAIVLACLIAVSGIVFGPNTYITHASEVHGARTIPLESLPSTDNNGVIKLSATHPGHYQGAHINHGLKLNETGKRIAFSLNKRFATLSGVLYMDDAWKGVACCKPMLVISDVSDPNNQRVIYQVTLQVNEQKSFSVSVRGVNTLAVETKTGGGIQGEYDVVADLTPVSPAPLRGQVIPRYPTGNAGEPTNSDVLFGWQPFPHATNYAFHIWLIGLSGSAALKSTTPFSFSASIYHKTSYTWDDHGFLPGTYQYSLLPLDDNGHNLAGWSTPTQITIASS